METDKEAAEYLNNKVIGYRGKIINDTIVLERTIDNFLAIYFTQHELDSKPGESLFQEMLDLIFSNERMSLGSKIEVFCEIIKKHYPDFLKANPNVNKDLSFIIQQRNILAHYLFDFSEEAIAARNLKVDFIKQKNKTTLIHFDKEIYEDVQKKLVKYMFAIHDLARTVI
jgi:hypothetical protein